MHAFIGAVVMVSGVGMIFLLVKRCKSINPKFIIMRFGIRGNDAFASDSGDKWLALLKSVEEKLRRQLEKIPRGGYN
jgi:hypothetical protein